MANLETMRAAMPSPVYGCACEGCACEVSWPAEDLQWHDGREEVETDDVLLHAVDPGFYCERCCSDLELEGDGPTLAEALAEAG